MPSATYYVQECPTCGRNLQIRIVYLGKAVVCQHCSAEFEAYDPSSCESAPIDSDLSLLERAERLIETASSTEVRL